MVQPQLRPHVDPALVRPFDYHSVPEFLADPFAAFDRTRGDRIFYSTAHGGYWVLTRADDIREAFQHPETFSNREFTIPSGVYPRTLRPLALDPPDHGKYRQPLAPLFSPASVARREPALREICRDLVSSFAADGSCDVLVSLARPFPTTVFVPMLGLPLARRPSSSSGITTCCTRTTIPEAREGRGAKILAYLDDLVTRRKAEGPTPTTTSCRCCSRTVDERPLDHDELVDYAFMLFIAGLDTVTAMLASLPVPRRPRPDLRGSCRSPTRARAVEELCVRTRS